MNERGKRLSRMSEAKLELLACELERLQADERRRAEPIAVLGMGCRFPGGANDAAAFWALLESGRDVCGAPPERGWASGAPHGYFLDDVQRFDASLFGISPREARSIDPQQRLLLEVTWQALEDAGYSPRALVDARVGVYVGAYADDYAHQLVWSGDVDDVDAYTSTGTSHAIAVGRLAHVFGLRGPVMAVDTACSSSLVAVHLACAALRAGECDLALVGGVSLALSAETPFTLERARMLAADGRSKTFSARADGYGRGEGCGMVVLRRASEARNERQRILAQVRGSAVNHDGRASSLTAPNGSAQVDVIRRALAAAGVDPTQVHALECHGTGTPLGDPIEVRALREVFDGPTRRDQPLQLSAVKSNIGHLEAAAGVAGFIKMVLALEHEQLPRSLHVDALNPELADDVSWMNVTRSNCPWPRTSPARFAGVSSFGFGGTNAHVVLERGSEPPASNQDLPRSHHVLTLSATSRESLRELARRTAALVEQGRADLGDLCLTANAGRCLHAERAALDASDAAQLCEALEALAMEREHAKLRRATVKARPRCVLAFAGQGAQFPDMGRTLFERVPSFRADLLHCERILEARAGFRLSEVVYGAEQSKLTDTRYAQPALFAFEYALGRLWLRSGIEPVAVLGHSVGEYVAAHFAGVLELEAALSLVAERGRLMGALPAGGGMLVVLSEPGWVEAQRQRLADFEVAAFNAPGNVVISGALPALSRVQEAARKQGIRTQRLDVSHAFHSRLMDPMLADFQRSLSELELASPSLPLLSNLTGGWADDRVKGADYWMQHLRQPVRFADNLRAAHERGMDVLLEIGPSTTLSSLARQVAGSDTSVVPTLRVGRNDLEMLDEASRALFLAGAEPTWTHLRELNARRCSFPSYPFAGERYQHPSAAKGEARLRGALCRSREPALLGDQRRIGASGDVLYERELRAVESEVAVDHRLFGSVIVPGAYHVALALSAAGRRWPQAPLRVTGAEFYAPLRVDAGRARRLQTLVQGRADGQLEVSVHAEREGSDELDCHAKLSLSLGAGQAMPAAELEPPSSELPDFYERMRAAGFDLGARFRFLGDVRCGQARAVARLRRPSGCAGPLHEQPGFLDSCFQLLAAAAHERASASDRELFVPVGLDALELYPCPGDDLTLSAALDLARSTPQTMIGEVRVSDARGRVYLQIRGLCARRMPRSAFEPVLAGRADMFRSAWQELTAPSTPVRERLVVVGASSIELGELRAALAPNGGSVVSADASQLYALEPLDQLLLFLPPLGGQDADAARRAATQLLLDALGALLDGPGVRPRLRVVTRDGQPLEDREALDEGAHAFTGLLRSLAFEHPELRPGSIDVEQGAALNRGFVAALGIESETVLAVRGDRCFAPRLERQATSAGRTHYVRDGGSYLVTGGLGGLGRYTARWLLERGAARVVLLGRRASSPDLRDELAALHPRAGGRVEYVSCDVADRAGLAAAIRATTSQGLPWLGVVHAAGMLDDGVLVNQTAERFAEVASPKVRGTLNLVEALREYDLDWWVFFSSMAASIGSPGQGSYAFANSFLDGMAYRLAAEGEHAVSIAWGPFADVGMAARHARDRSFVEQLPPEEIGQYIESALGSLRGHVSAMRLDFSTLAALYPTPHYLERVLQDATERSQDSALGAGARGSGISLRLDRASLTSVPAGERRSLLLGGLIDALAAIVELPAERLDADQSLASIGLDSLSSLELKNAVENTLGVRLSISALLRGPTLRELAELIDAELGEPVPVDAALDTSGEFLEHLDDRQVAALLAHLSEQESHVAS